MTLIEQIQDGEFLPAWKKLPLEILNFWGTDTETSYQENLKNQPLDWYYRDSVISYQTNPRGYRTSEFDSIDWANSVVIFGCSNVFGVGLHNEDTLSSQLNTLINKPVINMGAGASSMEFSLFNSIILNKHYPIPRAVIQIWTHHNRTSYYLPYYVEHLRVWNNDRYIKAYLDKPSHCETHGFMAQLTSRSIWEDKTKYYESSFFLDTAKLLKIPHFEFVDHSRDQLHPGRITIKNLASTIKNELNL